jgi:hypothetical protein
LQEIDPRASSRAKAGLESAQPGALIARIQLHQYAFYPSYYIVYKLIWAAPI